MIEIIQFPVIVSSDPCFSFLNPQMSMKFHSILVDSSFFV